MATAEAPPAHIEGEEGKAGVGGPEQEAAPAGGGLMQRFKAAVGLGGTEEAGKPGQPPGAAAVAASLRVRPSKAAEEARLVMWKRPAWSQLAGRGSGGGAGRGSAALPAARRPLVRPTHLHPPLCTRNAKLQVV